MKTRELVLAVFGVIILIFFGYWVFSGISNNSPSLSRVAGGNGTSGNNAPPSSADTNVISGDGRQRLSTSSVASGIPIDRSGGGLTEAVASNLSNEFMSNWDGTTSTASINVLANQIDLSNFKQELAGKQTDMSVDVGDEFIRTTDNVSTSSLIAYGNAYVRAIVSVGHYLSDIDALDSVLYLKVVGQDATAINSLMADNQKALQSLRTLTVPKIFVSFQKENLALVRRLDRVLTFVDNSNNDPLQAWVALNDFPNIIKQWINIRNQLVLVK